MPLVIVRPYFGHPFHCTTWSKPSTLLHETSLLLTTAYCIIMLAVDGYDHENEVPKHERKLSTALT